MNMFQKSCLRVILNRGYIGLAFNRYKNSSDYFCIAKLWSRGNRYSTNRGWSYGLSYRSWGIRESRSWWSSSVGSHHHYF